MSDDSTLINDNIYVTTIVLWNAGDLEIKQADIRKRFEISVPEDKKILDYKIVSETHPDVSKFRIVEEKERLVLDWDFFDPGFGVEIQITYTGIEKTLLDAKTLNDWHELGSTSLKVEGYILGKKIKEVNAKSGFEACVLIALSFAMYFPSAMIFPSIFFLIAYKASTRTIFGELQFLFVYLS